jgi:hypothetical protein
MFRNIYCEFITVVLQDITVVPDPRFPILASPIANLWRPLPINAKTHVCFYNDSSNSNATINHRNRAAPPRYYCS